MIYGETISFPSRKMKRKVTLLEKNTQTRARKSKPVWWLTFSVLALVLVLNIGVWSLYDTDGYGTEICVSKEGDRKIAIISSTLKKVSQEVRHKQQQQQGASSTLPATVSTKKSAVVINTTSATVKQRSCFTQSGKQCVFPFYDPKTGRTHTQCVTNNRRHQPWCTILHDQPGQWDYCVMRTLDGKDCHLPFRHNHVLYKTCTGVDHDGTMWCYTEGLLNVNRAWGNCVQQTACF